MNNNISMNLDTINKINNNIPENFNWKVYVNITKDNSLTNVNLAYNHYIRVGRHNSIIYNQYWKNIYEIPSKFNEDIYKKYLKTKVNLNLSFKSNQDLYHFYNIQGKILYPLNDEYYKLYYDIPNEFDTNIYSTIYSEVTYNNVIELYEFYNNNKNQYPLDDNYYRLYYNIPDDFDLINYNILHNTKFNSNKDAYIHYNKIGKIYKVSNDNKLVIRNTKNNNLSYNFSFNKKKKLLIIMIKTLYK